MKADHEQRSKGEMPDSFRPHFQGEARFQFYASPFEPDGPGVFSVHFEPHARTRPHVHLSGQVLYISSGEGIVADRSGRRTVGPGDVVTVEPGEWHWHGATPDSPMSHVTVQIRGSEDVVWDVDQGDWSQEP